MEPKIAVAGAGALGVMFGQKLTKAYGNSRVFFAADPERTARYRENTFTCNGESCDFRFSSSLEQEGKADLVIYAVKFNGLEDALRLTEPLVGEDTVLISLLNGISSEEIISKTFSRGRLLYCIAQGMDATKNGYSVQYHNLGKLLLGNRDNRTSDELERAVDWLEGSGIPCCVPEDIIYCQWSKLMLNAGINQVSAVLNIPYGGVQFEGEARRMVVDSMKEVQKVAACEGIALTDGDVKAWLDLLDSLNPEGMPSMRQDTAARRKTEVELFSGTIRRLGKKYSVKTPVNDFLYEKIKEMEAGW